MEARTRTDGITFAVHEVEPVRTPLQKWRTEEGINRILSAAEGRETTKVESCSEYNSRCVAGLSTHGLIAAVHLAFSEHRPLAFSPDMIWVTILQGFAQHVKNNSELLRGLLVQHQGKIKISAVRDDVNRGTPENDWESVVHQLSEAVHDRVGTTYGALLGDFSTTGAIERTVCEIALLDAYQPYFQYEVMCICGIPEITLEGQPSDWGRLRQKIDLLKPYHMDWWLVHLRAIADQFYRASTGDVDRQFWQNIYKLSEAYGAKRINGWIGKLIPYVKSFDTGAYTIVNPLLTQVSAGNTENVVSSYFGGGGSGITSDVIPSGLAMAPFSLATMTNSVAMEFLGGFVGVEQNELNYALRPKLGWAVRQAPEDAEQCLPEGSELIQALPLETIGINVHRLTEKITGWGAGLPGDLLAFYKTCDGVKFPEPSAGRFRSFNEVEVLDELGAATVAGEPPPAGWPPGVEPTDYDKISQWIRFFDNADGSFYAVASTSPVNDYRRVLHMLPSGEGKLFAWTFAEAVQKILESAGSPSVATSPSQPPLSS